ncbi:TetR/AcrR family transcriptional regulator [Saccharomonospora sp.]|uniref:TetR/AcrR family transcriptional regulator n=1 Tax=Saccharomonospora sp. TaxID=33913 RepID=UPI00262A977B|nr:TetR/AcrR family transcriptional regulator [Saccharomonospora sp.]
MPPPRPARTRTGRPPVTSRAQIMEAARRLIDRDGWEKLTLRRLATELGIGTTTLYHHVRDKEDLMVQLITDHADRMPHPELPDNPRERIIVAAIAIHDALAALPWAAEALTVDGFLGRLGDTALWHVETIVAGAVAHGCTPEQAVDVFRNIWYYTVGEILVRARTANHRHLDREKLLNQQKLRFDNRDSTQLPHLAAIGNQWPTLASRDIYPQGLRAFVDGLLSHATTDTAPLSR